MAPDPSFPVDQKKREECLDQLATLYRGLNDQQKKMIVTSYMADPDLVNDGKATPLFHKKYDEWAARTDQFEKTLNSGQRALWTEAMKMMREGGFHFGRGEVAERMMKHKIAVEIVPPSSPSSPPPSEESYSSIFQNSDAVLAVTEQIKNGPIVMLGHFASTSEPFDAEHRPDSLDASGNVLRLAFDRITLGSSEIAQLMEGHIASVFSLNDRGVFRSMDGSEIKIPSLPDKIDELKVQNYKFTDLDRTVMMAMLKDFDSRKPEYFAAANIRRDYERNRMELENISREMGNDATPGYVGPGKNFAEGAPDVLPEFIPVTLGPDTEPLKIDPAFLKIDPGFVIDPHPYKYRYEPDEPDGPGLRRLFPERTKIDPAIFKSLPEPRDFTLTVHKGAGPIPYNEDALEAQKLMIELKKLDPDHLKGVNLGHFGANKDGVDGQFGKKTYDSVIAMEKYLGIDPPTGEITDEFVTKMRLKSFELSLGEHLKSHPFKPEREKYPVIAGMQGNDPRLAMPPEELREILEGKDVKFVGIRGSKPEIDAMLANAGAKAGSEVKEGPLVTADSKTGPDLEDALKDTLAVTSKNSQFTA